MPAKRGDMDLVIDFVRSSAHWYRPIVAKKDMGQHSVDENWAETNFKRRNFYIGYNNGEPVGTISMQNLAGYSYLGYIYLDVAHVGKGFGRQLIRFAEAKSRENKNPGMILIAHPEADWAQSAYLKYGFEIIASEKEKVLSWKGGVLKPYYEEGFELFSYDFAKQKLNNNALASPEMRESVYA